MLPLLLLACTDGSPDPDSTSDDTGWTVETAAISDGGSFYMMYSADPDPIPFNEPFQLIAMVHDGPDHSSMYSDASLVVNATMPDHGHGMNTEPTVTVDEMGMITVDGMLFHMRGWWQMDFVATRSDVTETATFYVDCCED
jgi:hypothetical protein